MDCLGFPISLYSLDFHCLIGRSFYVFAWLWKIGIESIEGFGARLLEVPGRSKEGDQSFGPGTRVGTNAWPSVMMEIGYSGGEDFLHLDAQWWLINSADKIRFMILASITMNPLELRIECWRMLESDRHETGPTPPMSRPVPRKSILTQQGW